MKCSRPALSFPIIALLVLTGLSAIGDSSFKDVGAVLGKMINRPETVKA